MYRLIRKLELTVVHMVLDFNKLFQSLVLKELISYPFTAPCSFVPFVSVAYKDKEQTQRKWGSVEILFHKHKPESLNSVGDFSSIVETFIYSST